jgi:chromosome partitioning protein
VLKDSAEIDNASARLMSVYELEGPVTSRDTYQRCLTYLNAVNAEVETLIRLTWPSHSDRLRADGVI